MGLNLQKKHQTMFFLPATDYTTPSFSLLGISALLLNSSKPPNIPVFAGIFSQDIIWNENYVPVGHKAEVVDRPHFKKEQ